MSAAPRMGSSVAWLGASAKSGRESHFHQDHGRAARAEIFGEFFGAGNHFWPAVRRERPVDDALLQIDEDKRGRFGVESEHGGLSDGLPPP